MIAYVDSSALLKRVVREDESASLRAVLTGHDRAGDLLTASALAWVEVWRAVRRAAPAGEVDALAALALSGVAEIPLSGEVLDRARRIGPRPLRSRDALHLASAVGVNASVLLTYDDRLAVAAYAVGLAVHAPGCASPLFNR